MAFDAKSYSRSIRHQLQNENILTHCIYCPNI